MAANPSTLPVIFRAERSGQFKGEVTAVFPTEVWNARGDVTCYAHNGQHGGCSLEWYHRTRPATPAEYAPLLKELRSIYETSHGENDPVIILRVMRRRSYVR